MQVRTTEEALSALRGAITSANADIVGLVTQAQARAEAAVQGLERHVRMAKTRHQALVQMASADPPRATAGDVAEAQQRLSNFTRRLALAQETVCQIGALRQRLARSLEPQVSAAQATLSGLIDEVGRYRSAQAAGGVGRLAVVGPSTGSSPAAGSHGGPANLRDADVSHLSLADNPLTDEGKGGAKAADYEWAVQAWDSVIRPGLDRGETRDDFAARDEARDAPPMRRLADVHDMFLASDPVALSRGADGRDTIASGRHRIAAAQRLGVKSLPVRDV